MDPEPEREVALREGARRSLIACSLPTRDPLHVKLWRRWRWWLVAAGLVVLEALGMHAIGGVGGHF